MGLPAVHILQQEQAAEKENDISLNEGGFPNMSANKKKADLERDSHMSQLCVSISIRQSVDIQCLNLCGLEVVPIHKLTWKS